MENLNDILDKNKLEDLKEIELNGGAGIGVYAVILIAVIALYFMFK